MTGVDENRLIPQRQILHQMHQFCTNFRHKKTRQDGMKESKPSTASILITRMLAVLFPKDRLLIKVTITADLGQCLSAKKTTPNR